VAEIAHESLSISLFDAITVKKNCGLIFWIRSKKDSMKNLNPIFYFLPLLLLTTGCEIIGDIFGAGMYTGIFIVVFVIVIILVIVARIFKR
jgi:hypothetical protein